MQEAARLHAGGVLFRGPGKNGAEPAGGVTELDASAEFWRIHNVGRRVFVCVCVRACVCVYVCVLYFDSAKSKKRLAGECVRAGERE